MKSLILFAFIALSSVANAAGLMEDFDSLGGNDVLLEKAQALNPESRVRIVQDRIVDRRNRVEIAPEYSNILGGDAYNKTQMIGLNAYYHFTPRFSIGASYGFAFNELRPEGDFLLQDKSISDRGIVPEIDYPKSQYMGLVTWYPIYGKMNLYDLGVAHFDIYALAGAGQVQLKSGDHPTYTAGGGVGFWVSQHLSTRFEMRYQTYKAQRFNGEATMNLTVASVQVGYLL
jgi:outer membrane immunogenic protein